MEINLHFHVANLNVSTIDEKVFKQLVEKVNSLTSKIDTMGANTEQALADLQDIQNTLGKVKAETTASLAKITELEAAAQANADTPKDISDKIAEIKASLKTIDDLVPDAPPTESGSGEGTPAENAPQ